MNARSPRQPARAWSGCAALALCLVVASCGGGGSNTPAAATPASAGNPVIVSIGAAPTSLTLGESTTLTWSSSNASACQGSGAWSGALAASGAQILTPRAAGSYTYTLSCNGAASSATVVVAPATSPNPTVSVSLAPVSVPAGQQSTLTWSTTNASTCTASGAWAGSQATSGSIAVSQATAGTYSYGLTCTGASGSASGSVTLGATGVAANVALVFIDSGPAGASNIINVPFVSVTVCRPGTTTCQTIDHVMVDTGSYGLRIISPGILDPALALPAVTGANGNPAGECAQFFSGFLWGSVHRADVNIAGESASSLPLQLVSDSDPAFASIPSACSSTGANLGSVAALGANGILGVGLFKEDCGSACVTQSLAGIYYQCSASNCTGTAMPLANQVANPVAAFATDNNGVALALPAVPAGGATTLTGVLIFGIDTQSNNRTGSAAIYAVNSSGYFTTVYKGVSLASSFLDSGSNGLFFSDRTIAPCSAASGYIGFYCPAATLSLSAVNTAANGGVSGTVNFSIESARTLAPAIRAASVGGSIGRSSSRTFDWGMPFFFGRTVFVAIEGAGTLRGPGPYWAY
jgi:hypothetical protein